MGGLTRYVLIACLLVLATAAVAAESADIPREVADLMQDRKYAEAIAAIDRLAKHDAKHSKHELLYLKGRAQHLTQDYDAAIATFEAIATADPKGALGRRARFAKAVALARKGDYRAAEVLYHAEADRLLSLDRKQEIANIYLEFAESYFQPTKLDRQPDYAKALEFYKRAPEVGPQLDKRAALELRIAECHQRLGQYNEAIALLGKFIADRPTDKLVVEARFRLGESQLASGNVVEARRTWQDLLRQHRDDASPRVAEAAFRLAATFGLPQPGSNEDLSLGVAALEAFLEKYPDHKFAGEANLLIVQSYLHRGRHEQAVAAAKRFLADDRYTKREELSTTRFLLGEAYLRQRKYDEALAALADFLTKHPAHAQWARAQQEIIQVEFLKAESAYEAKNYDQARKLWDAFLAKYPLDARNPLILLRYGQMKQAEKKHDDALAAWRQLVSKYPGTNEASQAQFLIGATLEDHQGEYEQAIAEFKKLNWGNYTTAATQRINRLTAKSMTVATERVFRTGEQPTIKLTTRNIDVVTIRAYRVDLETYFRKMHLATGIEQLDISLIDPDHTFEYKVADYQPHKQFENLVEVPLPTQGDLKAQDSGVMAITVSSKSLEATTLAMKSDLDIVVKSSRDELLVFAQNLRTGKPWPGARVLISNGSQVFAEETTGDDGVFHRSYKQLAEANDLRVFAMAEGHTASNVVGLSGIGVASGLTDKGYIYTDRPAYRAGQLVNVRGVIRKVDGDRYVVAQGKKYRCDVFDNRNRLMYEAEVALSGFGSFFTNFTLPAASPSGQYRIVVHDNDKQSYEGSFVVHEYQLEPVRLEVTSDRMIYYRGEEIVGKVKASYYYGAPLVGKELRYRLANGRVETAKTNEQGEVEFKLETADYREAQPLELYVELPERSLATTKVFFLATQAFSLGLDAVRRDFLAGESFDVTITAKDAEQKPIAEALTLQVLEQTTVDGQQGEVEREKHAVKTDPKTGVARHTLRLEQGGTFTLRISGVDRFQNTITSDLVVRISDDKDATRLRVFANQHTYRVGDTGEVIVHWREAPALALVTFEGSKILEYKLVQLQTGANKLQIPFTAALAPNFTLAVAVMTDARRDPKAMANEQGELPAVVRFHEAQSSFAVERDLRIKLTHAAKNDRAPQPGEKLEVVIETTDPQGKPLSAELSLALIDQALLDRFGWTVPKIDEFFRDPPRTSAMRTMSSVTFAYHPSTKPIDPQLLAEADRLELEAAEASRREALAGRGEVPLPSIAGVVDATPPPPSDVSGELASGLAPYAMPRPARSGGEDAYDADVLRLQLAQQEQAQFGGNAVDHVWYAEPQGGNAAPLSQRGLGRNVQGYLTLSDHDQRRAGLEVRNLYEQQLGDVQLVQRDGTVTNLNLNSYFGTTFDEKKAEELVASLKKTGAVLMAQSPSLETGYWNPSIVTDAKGQAKVEIQLPERSTAWKLLARGITVDTLAGETEDSLQVQKPLFAQLRLPLAFTEGDNAQVAASIHNNALEEGEIKVIFSATIAGKKVEQKKTLPVKAKGVLEVAFDQKIELPADASRSEGPASAIDFELTIEAGEMRDTIRRSVPIQPFGMPVYAIRGGTSQGDVAVSVAAPKGISAPRMQILLGPNIEQSLLDALFAPTTWCQLDNLQHASGGDVTSSDLMAALALQQLIAETRDAKHPQAIELDARVRSALSALVAAQNDDGGWSWSGQPGNTHIFSTARVLWALSLAKKAGYRAGDEHAKAVQFLQAQVATTPATQYEARAVMLHALTVAGKEDLTLANQLYRNRQALSAAAIAHLALAYIEMDRKQTAAEILSLADKKDLDASATTDSVAWNQSPAEIRALYAIALGEVAPTDARLIKQIEWLMANRVGHRWSPDKATGPALLAVSKFYREAKFATEKYRLRIFVNDLLAKEVEVTPDTRTQAIDVDSKLLKAEKPDQVVRIELVGRGRFSYQCVLGGFVAADKLANTTQAWRVERTYEPAQLELFGEAIPRGFDVVAGPVTSFRNELSQLPVGKRGRVELRISRPGVTPTTADHAVEYLVVTEPIPAGASVIENSVSGAFERFEIGAGQITFYVGAKRSVGTIAYEVHGYLPGAYRAAPTVVRNAYRLDQMAVAKTKDIQVLPLGERSSDKYRLTPRELYELGKRQFDKGQLAEAAPHLNELLSQWSVGGDFYKDSVRMLLDINLAQNKPAEVVKYFEILVEKFPDVELSFDKFVQAGEAYHKVGEYERAYMVFRAVIEASFLRESRVAGFLQEQGEFLRSVEVMSNLLGEYPAEPYIAAATYALAQNIYAKAPEVPSDQKLREKRITRIDLIQQARQRLDRFLTEHPDDPAADEASFSLANALLDMELYDKTIERATRFAVRYPTSSFLDSYWYIIGFSHYARGEHKQALEMCEKVAEATRVDPATGRTIESPNKWQAVYILGQIYHSLGQPEKAIEYYQRVNERFADAREAIEFFSQKTISTPDVVTFKPGEAATLELKYRNVPAVDVTVYRIDLMKFSLLRRSLKEVTRINLAGIRPTHEENFKLGNGKDFREKTASLKLPLKEEGAYLVVCRGENLHASSLVVVSPLVIEVQEEVTAGRVRTTVRDVVKDIYMPNVHVKTIGARNSEFVSGDTDLRGIFVADGIQGVAMVIAHAGDGRYAFYRGTRDLGPPPEVNNAPAQAVDQPQQREVTKGGKDALLDDLRGNNRFIQEQQQKQLKEYYDNGIQGGFNSGGVGGGVFNKAPLPAP